MDRLLFPIFAVFVLWGLNALILYRTFNYFGIKISPRFYLISVILSFLFPASMMLHNFMPNQATRFFYIIGALWLGMVFLGFFVGIICDLLFYLWKNPTHAKGYIWVGSMALLTAYGYYNQAVLAIKNVDIPVKNLTKEIGIGYLSDVHIDGIHNLSYLDSIIEKLNRQDIDIVLINGDMVDGTSFEKHSFQNLDNLKVPVFITFGNHETYIGKDYALSLFKDTKARVLQDEVADFGGLQILGSEDLFGLNMAGNKSRLDTILKSMSWDKNKPSLLLLHEPIGPEIADSYGIDVQLAGHTHNGQIWPFTLVVKQFFPYMMGLYKVGDLSLYVGPGSGVWGPPMRIGSQSEITIIHLVKK